MGLMLPPVPADALTVYAQLVPLAKPLLGHITLCDSDAVLDVPPGPVQDTLNVWVPGQPGDADCELETPELLPHPLVQVPSGV